MSNKITIIGAGIVGLATAYQLLKKNPNFKIQVIEKEADICKHQTGNNSGVIHSGIYYKPGSLKAQNCHNGYKMLIDFCNQHDVRYELCGKVIVAANESEIPALENIYERGNQNGLENLKYLSKEELREIEPHVKGVKGIRVPQTGIIDFVEMAEKIKVECKKLGAEFIFNQEVKNIIVKNAHTETITNDKSFVADYVVSCTGLHSDRIAKTTNRNLDLRIIPFRGEYYKLKDESKHLVTNLIYPVPDPAFPFLGVHFTRMIDGAVEAGPNAVLAFAREGYKKFDFNLKDTTDTFTWPGFHKVAVKYWKTGFGEFYRSFSKKAFVKALQKLIPKINESDLVPGGAGVRAQACDIKGKLLDDFYFAEQERVIHVCNAPSPAATASLSIGNHISQKLIASMN
ncbi:MAG: L-2-hydroxyglutarate oxidase [Melioribacteraceae bacterium]|nr:L-2-hydroxyglutarate oxidase [Melioribacteraceae bacterium]MCF8354539.1 L-2-hydroxyglutarate oxidase [Melioribacteraceae bacterium]MCF8393835.1 L-2-hydroxyglutarate oxidase [Melioribacteraceae bacterium]MCF8418208.1 L-2-hydroxyglutarate oxidase [Melioribacteraceae bacterium]